MLKKISLIISKIFAGLLPEKKCPTSRQWHCLFKVLPAREKYAIKGLVGAIIASAALLVFVGYIAATQAVPQIGGHFREGILGQPRFINPILAQTNDADRDLVQLVYSSLFKYDRHGDLIADLAKDYTISQDGLTYTVFLKENLKWHDQEPLTAKDVIFTIQTIQDPEYKSPLKANWQSVEINEIDDLTIEFKLKNIYAPFLHNLTVGILPKHLWTGISAQNFALALYNLQPVGSGPYVFDKLNNSEDGTIESMELARNDNFYLEGPFIEKITLRFYNSQENLLNAYKKGQLDAISNISIDSLSRLARSVNLHQIKMPIYYAVFFNQTESEVLSDETVRQALAHATDKQELLEKVLDSKGDVSDSPIPSDYPAFNDQIERYDFSIEEAERILEENDWTDENGDGIREKEIDDEITNLEINLIATNWPEMTQTAELIKKQWERLGAIVNIDIIQANVIQQEYIRPRQYQALIFGEVLGADPDPFAFWHSSHKKDPGLNLSLYQNTDVDKLLEEARQTLDIEERNQRYAEFQSIVSKDLPAIFLFSPDYLYPASKRIKGINIEKLALPSHRFSQIETWYINSKRIKK